jgi:hypothetical protein
MNRQLFQYHPTLGYHFVPGLRARVEHEGGGYLVRVNQAGFRCEHEVTAERPAGVSRVLLFGDSYTAGDGVSNRDRYGDVMESLLTDVEVLNFGLSGSGTDQQYLAYREFAREVEHDVLVIAVLVENIRRVAARYRPYQPQSGGDVMLLPKPYFTLREDGGTELHNVPVPRDPVAPDDLPAAERGHVDRGGSFALLRQAVDKLGPRVKDAVQSLTGYQPVPMYDDPRNPDWLLLRAILSRWIAESPVPAIVVPLPLYQHVEETSDSSGYRARFEELGRETGAIIHDPLPDYHAVPPEERRGLRFGRDIHPTPAAHRLLAESLARTVARVLKRETEI